MLGEEEALEFSILEKIRVLEIHSPLLLKNATDR